MRHDDRACTGVAEEFQRRYRTAHTEEIGNLAVIIERHIKPGTDDDIFPFEVLGGKFIDAFHPVRNSARNEFPPPLD